MTAPVPQGGRGRAATGAAAERSRRGAALVLVIVVLGALALIAAPFALSMRNLEAGSLQRLRENQARAGTGLVLAAARRHLEETHPLLDVESPHRDDLDEISPADLDVLQGDVLSRNPQGSIRSVTVDDLSGRAHLGTASPYLLGNLLGGRTSLTEDVGPADDVLPLVDLEGWPEHGLAWIGNELVEYASRGAGRLEDCRRGYPSANLAGSRALAHRSGDDVLDLRLLLLAQHGWRIRPGLYDAFRRVDGLKDIGLFGEAGYSADEVDAARGWLTVQPAGMRFVDAQALQWIGTDRFGHTELGVADGSRFGPGTVVQLEDDGGEQEWNLVVAAVDWDDHWRLRLLEPVTGRHGDESVLRRLKRRPVNVNTAPLPVLTALLTGLGRQPISDVVTLDESLQLAQALTVLGDRGAASEDLSLALREPIEAGDFSAVDLAAAGLQLRRDEVRVDALTVEELAARILGAPSRRSVQRISSRQAGLLADRIRAGRPGSHEELAALLDGAVGAGECTAGDREVILRNAVDAGDAEIVGGTAPFAYASAGWFEVNAAASVNHPNGREQARAFARQVVAVAPPGETGVVFTSQQDFDVALAHGAGARGWESHPRLLAAGTLPETPSMLEMSARFATVSAEDDVAVVDLVSAFDALVGLPTGRIDRAGALLARLPAASTVGPESSLQPATVRSSLPHVLHFDEGLPGLMGQGPGGMRLGDTFGMVLQTERIRPAVTGSDGRLQPFTVEFWMELDDVTAETILFDGGVDELEDRVLIYVDEGELVLRVCDTSIPDFEASMPAGRPPPAGEIRYAFNDGLSLLADVPYHVAAWIGGARDTDLALFVDGVPRGQRSFTTRLTEDVDSADGGVGAGVASYIGKSELPVESTAGFPRQGVLRVGREIVEYIDKTEDAFVLASAGSNDPFGGRARRGTPGPDHEASERVELMGYSRALRSQQASRGAGVLASALSRFSVAELDPSRLTSDTIFISVGVVGGTPVVMELGTGLLAGSTSIPVRASGSAPFDANTFQATGGHALLVCDYGGGAVSGGSITAPGSIISTPIGAQTQGGWLGGVEVIRYAGFSGGTLTGVQRGGNGVPQSVGSAASPLSTGSATDTVVGGSSSFSADREWVTEFDAAILGQIQGLPDQPRVLVIPISVGVTGGNVFRDYHPDGQSGSGGARAGGDSAVAQLGLDFELGADATEWVRWTTATPDHMVRDDLDAVNAAVETIKGLGLWNPAASTVDQNLANRLNGDMDFRAQDGTAHGDHTGGSSVLPTIAVGAWRGEGLNVMNGIPGRHDAVTLVDADGSKEWHRINHATTNDQDWSNYALVAFRAPVLEVFDASDRLIDENYAFEDLPFDEHLPDPDSAIRKDVERFNMDSRRLTRLIKRPSGELPAVPIEAFSMGRDYAGRLSRGSVVVDELRFATSSRPGALLQKHFRYVLNGDLDFEEDDELRLSDSMLRMAHGTLASSLLGPDALEILSALNPAGGLLLIGEEIVGYAGIDTSEFGGTVYITERGLFGTERAFHEGGTSVSALDFWPATPLAGRISPEQAFIPLSDPAAFPDAPGLAWIDGELVGFEGVDDGALTMPIRYGAGRLLPEGLLRGRFGTGAADHDAGAMVRWMPARRRDRALLGSRRPESEFASLSVEADGAFFTEVVVQSSLPVDEIGLDLRFVLDGRASPHDAPAPEGDGDAALVGHAAEGRDAERTSVSLGRQADRLDLYLFARWFPGAFDAERFASHGWKLGPAVETVTVGHVQPDVVLEHEEWR